LPVEDTSQNTRKELYDHTRYFHETVSDCKQGSHPALTMLGIVSLGSARDHHGSLISKEHRVRCQNSIQAIGSNLLVVWSCTKFRLAGASVNGAARTLTVEGRQRDFITSPKIPLPFRRGPGRYQVTAKGTNTNTSVTGKKAALCTQLCTI